MSLQRFFLAAQILSDESAGEFALDLSADDLKHLKVLRLTAGEHIAVIDASSDYFECEITGFQGALPMVRIAQHVKSEPVAFEIFLVQGLAKGDKVDAVIRHATELGVRGFYPVSTMRSIVKLDEKRARNRCERWRAIAKSAAMQSGQPAIPAVCAPASLKSVCAALSDFDIVLVCWEESPITLTLSKALEGALDADRSSAHPLRVAVVVGPEGGLASEEVDLLLACGKRASLVSLGPSILRTETAGIVAPALVRYELARICEAHAS